MTALPEFLLAIATRTSPPEKRRLSLKTEPRDTCFTKMSFLPQRRLCAFVCRSGADCLTQSSPQISVKKITEECTSPSRLVSRKGTDARFRKNRRCYPTRQEGDMAIGLWVYFFKKKVLGGWASSRTIGLGLQA